MGNSNETPKPGYSKWGIFLGQALQYKNYTKNFDKKKLEELKKVNLQGKRYLITGASSGLGKFLCQILVNQGASLIMVSRSMERLEKAKQEIIEEAKKNQQNQQNYDIQCKTLDLANVDQVRSFSEELLQENIELDGLVNNGGALPQTQVMKQWKGGEIEETIACHLVGPYILNYKLLPLLEKRSGMLVNNTSAGSYSQKLETYFLERNMLDFVYRPKKDEKPNDDKKYKDGAMVYAQCKRAMLEMTTEFVKFLESSKSNVKIISMHPGWAKTPGLDNLFDQQPQYKNYKFRDADQAAYGMAYPLAFADKMKQGKYYFDGEEVEEHKCWAGTSCDQKERDRLMKYLQQFL